jgi:hypothetical protein
MALSLHVFRARNFDFNFFNHPIYHLYSMGYQKDAINAIKANGAFF